MPLPPIAVDVAPPSKDQALVQMLLDACSRAASPVKCVSAESVDTGNVSALALVVWLPESEGVRIQVGAKRGEQKVSELQGASKSMYKSMSETQLEELASTKRKNLPKKKG